MPAAAACLKGFGTRGPVSSLQSFPDVVSYSGFQRLGFVVCGSATLGFAQMSQCMDDCAADAKDQQLRQARRESEKRMKLRSWMRQSVAGPLRAEESRVEKKIGNILEATEDYIAHQCNCCMHNRTVEGIAKAIYGKYPDANPYTKRDSDPTKIDEPGTAFLHKPVLNLYAQFAPGKPVSLDGVPGSKWEKQFVTAREKGLLAVAAADSTEERLKWFKQCLDTLPNELQGPASIAFPKGIGCGLAGGKWEDYLAAIEDFAAANPRFRIVIYEFQPKANL